MKTEAQSEAPKIQPAPRMVHSIVISHWKATQAASNRFQLQILKGLSGQSEDERTLDSTTCGRSREQTSDKPPPEGNIRRTDPGGGTSKKEPSDKLPLDGFIWRTFSGGKDESKKKPPDKPPDTFIPSAARFSRATGSSLGLTSDEKSKRVHQEPSSCSPKRAVSAPVSAIRFGSPDAVSVLHRLC
jgi:hypothetical protein